MSRAVLLHGSLIFCACALFLLLMGSPTGAESFLNRFLDATGGFLVNCFG